MSQYLIEIDDKAIINQINGILDDIIQRELRQKYSGAGAEVSSAVKDLIYSRKDEIIELVIERATKEIVKKGLPKLIERIEGAK